MKEEKTFTSDFFKNCGKKGGSTTAKRGKKYYEEMGRKGAIKRWSKRNETCSQAQ